MCTVEVPTCRPICIAEVLRKAMRVRNHLNRRNTNSNEPNFSFARRALFNDGPVDHELTAQFLAQETERIRRDVSARWNFDFETETPLVGRYLWTPVHENPTLPAPSSETVEEPVPELVSVAESSSASQRENSSPRRVTKQKRLTDYMPQRKRPAASKQRELAPESKIPRRTDASTSTDTTKA